MDPAPVVPLSAQPDPMQGLEATLNGLPQQGGQVKDFGASAIISLVIGLISLASNIGMGVWSNKKQNQYNNEMLDKQNAYNHPAEQKKRLEEAGYNPLAMVSGGSSAVSSGNSELGQKTAPHFNIDALQMMSLMSMASQIAVNKAQVRNLDSSSALKSAQALTESSKQQYYGSQAAKADFWTSDYAPSQIERMRWQNQLTAEQIKTMPLESAAKIDLWNATKEQREALTDRYSTLNDLNRQQIKESITRIGWYQALVSKINAEIPYINSLRDVADMQYVKNCLDVVIKSETATLQGEKAKTWNWEKGSQIFRDIMNGLSKGEDVIKLLLFLFK